MARHFANTTIVGEYNLTAAEKFSVFLVIVDERAESITADPDDPPLTFDANVIPEGAVPQLGYLPFEVSLSLPRSADGRSCPPFALHDVSIEFTLNGGKARTREYAPLTFTISGCSRDYQSLHNLSFAAVGYANLQLSFVSLLHSHDILSLEQPGGGGGEALHFDESKIVNSTFRYFGDVTGAIGMSYGATQNGSIAIDVSFFVADPALIVPQYQHRGADHTYTFGWYGSYPQEWGNAAQGWVHLQRCHVQYLRDVSLGSVNVSSCTFGGWFSEANPTFARWAVNGSALPPSISLYKAESRAAAARSSAMRHGTTHRAHRELGHPRRSSAAAASAGTRSLFGCNVSDSLFLYAWDVDVLRSAVSRSQFQWAADGLGPYPTAWARKPLVNPSFWLSLRTDKVGAGFVQSMNDSLLCLRPRVAAAGGLPVPEQNVTIDNGSLIARTPVWHTPDAACHAGERRSLIKSSRS